MTFAGQPYPNGRNQESSSEAISAYEAVALYGRAASRFVFGLNESNASDAENKATCERVYNMGRLLLATEIISAQVYYHVEARNPHKPLRRIYPDIYEPKVVGMLWSMLAQQQTWFGAQPWKSYGIQLMPLTPAAVYRDQITWVDEMLPIFNASCWSDPGN